MFKKNVIVDITINCIYLYVFLFNIKSSLFFNLCGYYILLLLCNIPTLNFMQSFRKKNVN